MRATILGCIVLLAVAGCSKSEEGEAKRWQSATRSLDELSVLYPGFKSALEEQRQKATAAMDAAREVADEQARIKAMSAANNLVSQGFVGQLRDMDRRIKRLREKLVDVAGKAVEEADRRSAAQASAQANRALSGVEEVLRRGAPDAAAAAIVVKKAAADLRAAEDLLDKVARAAQQRTQQQAKDTAGAAAPDTPPAATTWTCEYCDTANQPDSTTCHNCGAARP